ncbi:hypothetical protein DPEC_G00286900 [Dallia pectoralis]|uniref:Uncharacterized protein n=1 Tax=Dallia pectoralis TaxID=75939 RepID=A0ACC2FK15_DALPE|nr:hypothetical protein DPEC_G00286900 [Dallia pectoralis]
MAHILALWAGVACKHSHAQHPSPPITWQRSKWNPRSPASALKADCAGNVWRAGKGIQVRARPGEKSGTAPGHHFSRAYGAGMGDDSMTEKAMRPCKKIVLAGQSQLNYGTGFSSRRVENDVRSSATGDSIIEDSRLQSRGNSHLGSPK